MEMLIESSLKAMRSVFAPGMLGLFIKSVLLTVVVLTLFVIGASGFFAWFFANNPWIAWVGGIGSAMLAWFLFPGIMPVIVNFFDDRIAGMIEQQDYATSRPAQNPPFWPEFWHDVRFSLKAIALNILALPLYLIPVINLFLFYALNGYLLGREFFMMVAKRHMTIQDANHLRKRHGQIVMAGGIMLTVLATVPILNLFAPFWGIALMTHIYHHLSRSKNAEILLS